MSAFRQKITQLRRASVTSAFVLQMFSQTAFSAEARIDTRGSLDAQALQNWRKTEEKEIAAYLARRGSDGGPNEDFDFSLPAGNPPSRIIPVEEVDRDRKTSELVDLYYAHQGSNRFIGTFVESGAAHADNYQWNTQRWAGFAVKELRDRFLDRAKENGILNIRVGLNLHELDPKRPDTLANILDFHREAWMRGIAVTDSVLFFSGLQSLAQTKEGKIDPETSFQNNPDFPDWAEKLATFTLTAIFKEQRKFNEQNEKRPVAERLPTARTAVNPVNEPETFAGFNQFWNGGLARWDNPNVMDLYVPTIINIARANVRIRMAAERAAKGERVLFFHNEAMTPENYPSHHGDLQFAVSQLMLGDQSLMTADFKRLATEPIATLRERYEKNGRTNAVEACLLKYVLIPKNDTDAKIENARSKLLSLLSSLKEDHLKYAKQTQGKTAKTDTILMVDYYQQSEFLLPKPVPQLIADFAGNNGEKLQAVLGVQSHDALLAVLRDVTFKAERAIGHPLWSDDLSTLLSQEDGIVLDKLIGLRNEWSLNHDSDAAARRARVAFDLTQAKGDEKRIDEFLSSLLLNNSEKLKTAMNVKTDQELRSALAGFGIDASRIPLRDALNESQRSALHRIFGLERARFLGFLPPHYARQVRAGLRKGFYTTFLTYVDRLGLRVGGIGESGTPFYPWASLVHKQMMYELVAGAAKANFTVVRNDIGPAIGTIGWMAGPMTGSITTNGKRGGDGLFKLVKVNSRFDYQLSAWPGSEAWFTTFRDDFSRGLDASKRSISVRAKNVAGIMTKPGQRPAATLRCEALFH